MFVVFIIWKRLFKEEEEEDVEEEEDDDEEEEEKYNESLFFDRLYKYNMVFFYSK